MSERVIVEFTENSPPYNNGTRANLEVRKARRLIEFGVCHAIGVPPLPGEPFRPSTAGDEMVEDPGPKAKRGRDRQAKPGVTKDA